MDSQDLVDRLLAGERRALARLLSYVEDGPAERLRDIVSRLHPHTGRARLVGLTGPPGVGKSTIAAALVGRWRAAGHRVAVLAVDPSSPFSGGALLGDRVRMQDHVLDQGVFIRSMASRGHLGGLAWATPQAVLLLDAAGFDIVIVETVGVGQAEVEVAALADTTVVALAPGMGDAIQVAKAGVLEIADIFCVNKSEHEGADSTIRDLRDMQALGHGDWLAPICRTTATSGEGIDELRRAIDDHGRWLMETGRLEEQRVDRARVQIRELALAAVRTRSVEADGGALVSALAARVAARELDPYRAADALLDGIEAP